MTVNRRSVLAASLGLSAAAASQALAAEDKDRWLPLFWALDNFKVSQATNQRQNAGWMMPPIDEASTQVVASSKAITIGAIASLKARTERRFRFLCPHRLAP